VGTRHGTRCDSGAPGGGQVLPGDLEAAEREAREAKRGLWGKPVLIDPAEPPTPTPTIDDL